MKGSYKVTDQDYLDISFAPDAHSLQSRLVGFANRMDFGIVSGVLIVERPGATDQVLYVGNTPLAFVESQRSMANYSRDPVLNQLKHMKAPIVYDQKMYVDGGAADLWDNQAQFGFRTGIAMALHASDHVHFYLGVDRDTALPKKEKTRVRMMQELQMLAVNAQHAVTTVLLPFADAGASRPKLSPSEVKVLRWTRQGKSAKAIAHAEGLSYHTVISYIRTACAKLEVSTKMQAVVKAGSLGLI